MIKARRETVPPGFSLSMWLLSRGRQESSLPAAQDPRAVQHDGQNNAMKNANFIEKSFMKMYNMNKKSLIKM